MTPTPIDPKKIAENYRLTASHHNTELAFLAGWNSAIEAAYWAAVESGGTTLQNKIRELKGTK